MEELNEKQLLILAKEMLERFLEMHREYDTRPEDELYDYADDVQDLVELIKNAQ